jgi:hypothetical protein
MGVFTLLQCKALIYRVQVPYALELHLEALVSRKGGNREVTSEESETTKLGNDEQKPYTEAYLLG